MKIVLDFIPNHTGKKHEWFTKSEDKDPDYADFYIWADGVSNTSNPNNWVCECGLYINPWSKYLQVLVKSTLKWQLDY